MGSSKSFEYFYAVKNSITILIMKIKNNVDEKIFEEIMNSIQQIDYGEVVVTLHDSKVIQIEKKEKKRFQKFDERLHKQS